MYVDPNGKLVQIVAGALVGALFEVIYYISNLIVKHGKKFHKKINWKTLIGRIFKGAALGAIGIGIPKKLGKLANLSKNLRQ